MFDSSEAFSGFSVDNIDSARHFYADILGIRVADNEMGFLELHLASGASILIYSREDHVPATFTILNFPVPDIDTAVEDLNSRGVSTTIYSNEMPTDSKGIMRGGGPDIAWFKDPAGNVLSVLQPK